MLYVTFCYAPDEEMLRMTAARIHELDPKAKIYAINDARNPIKKSIEGVHFKESDVPRNNNLNGLAFVAAELAIFDKLLKEENADYITKIDCDLWPNDLAPFLQTLPQDGEPVPDYLSVERFEAFKPSGMIYRLSRWMVEKVTRLFNERSRAGLWTDGQYPEDTTIFALAQQTRLLCKLIPFATGYTAGIKDSDIFNPRLARAGVVHCGEPIDGIKRISREHATLRMRILKHAIEKP